MARAWLMLVVLAVGRWAGGEEIPREQLDFFENRIRPIFAQRCVACHGDSKQEADLRLDSRAGLLRGGMDGTVVKSGDPEASLLIQAVRYHGEVQMPPDGPLPAEQVAALEQWVKLGAPWPEGNLRHEFSSAAQQHWAFQPVREPPLPNVKQTAWPRNDLDRFVLAKLEAEGLNPSPPADRRTLLRRLKFDLLGLPPTWEEVEAFVNDPAPDAYARRVEEFLASPHYGVRWGRHWLDVARYADNRGYNFQQEREFLFAYTYRDWVVKALNDDLPYNQFLIQQLAADKLSADRQALAGLGYLTLGRRFLNNAHDIIDDRIDVVCRGMMGLTVSCARCHDHKYDPIPTADYYSLYGVFASTVEQQTPLEEGSTEWQMEWDKRHDKRMHFQERVQERALAKLRARVGDYWLAAHQLGPDALPPHKLSRFVINRWRVVLQGAEKGWDPVLSPWVSLTKATEAELPAAATLLRETKNPEQPINPLVLELFKVPLPASQGLAELADRYNELFARVEDQWREALAEAEEEHQPPPTQLSNADGEQVRWVLYGPESALNLQAGVDKELLDRPTTDQLNALIAKEEEWQRRPEAPRTAMALVDRPVVKDAVILVRGNPGNVGPKVPRQFLEVLSPGRKPFKQGSGRLELAQAIASEQNPLTPRVLVNRVWGHHFGHPLVGTPSDFGLRGDPPTHPELLDFLASRFMREGWSLKKLHREIVLSATYQQASDDRPEAREHDPTNHLLWRAPRMRLDFEAMRDAMLAVSGQLDLKIGGAAVDLTSFPYATRRTLYGKIDRQNLPGIFRTFDVANPDTHSPQRFETTVPQQALFWLNHPLVWEQAEKIAAQTADAPAAQDRLTRIYQRLFARPPRAEETAWALEYLAAETSEETSKESDKRWTQVVQALLASNEFLFID